MSEQQQSEPISGETGADMAAKSEPVMAAPTVEAPHLSPDQEATSPKEDIVADASKMEAPKVESAKVDLPKMDLPKINVPAAETNREEPRFSGKLMVMAPGKRTWDHEETAAKPAPEQPAKASGGPRFKAMAAMVALATVAGAIGGALATASFGHVAAPAVAAATDNSAKDTNKDTMQASLARIDGEILALKSSIEQTAKTGTSQFNRANDRLDKVEKAQAEPLAKLSKLSEAVDKLRAAPPVVAAAAPAPTQVVARETTGTVTPPTPAAAAPKPEVGRLPVVEGWALRDVGNGGALIESRSGVYEVYAGDPVPGLGRIDAIRKQDGRWVVVTSKGLIVSR